MLYYFRLIETLSKNTLTKHPLTGPHEDFEELFHRHQEPVRTV
jgi:hypothetical protein